MALGTPPARRPCVDHPSRVTNPKRLGVRPEQCAVRGDVGATEAENADAGGADRSFGCGPAGDRVEAALLCYHGVWVLPGESFGGCTFVPPEHFESRMARLKRSGRPVLPLGHAVELLKRDELPEAAVAITIDDGWVSTLSHMLPVLEAYDLPATLYATTWYSGRALPVVGLAVDYLTAVAGRPLAEGKRQAESINRLPVDQRLSALRRYAAELGAGEDWLALRQFNILSPEELREAHRRGLDIQLHTHRHIEVDTRVESLIEEVEENRAFLQDALGDVALDHFCYPSGRHHPDAPALLAASGIRSATLCDEGLNGPDANTLALRRLLDGPRVSDAEFDGYLSGMLHFLAPLRGLKALTQRQSR